MHTPHLPPSEPADRDHPLHTVLGAGGVIASELAACLAREPHVRLRLASRRAHAAPAGAEWLATDLLDAQATARAVQGSEVVYLVAGLRYDTATWRSDWPRVMAHTLQACQRHNAKLVFFDNVYAYGHVHGPMTEATPFNPCSRKGEVRSAIALTLLDAMARGEVQALIARSADFYGPGADKSLLHSVLAQRLQAGKVPQWIGNPKAQHSFTFTPDAGQALARLGHTPQAFGQTWHLPTSAEAVTGESLVRTACELAGRPYGLQHLPRWALKALGWWLPMLRENEEMMYQLEHDYRFDSRKIQEALGLQATPYREGLAHMLRSAA
jgi:nucleoside-diphosphate-sugar epimerase